MGYIFKKEVKTNKFDFNGKKLLLLYFLDFHNYYYYWQGYGGKEVIYKNKNKYIPLNFGSPTKIIKKP